MLSKKDMKQLANKIVNHSMKIGQKPNPQMKKIKKYKWLKGSFTLKQAVRKSKMSKKSVEKILKKYSDVRYGPLIYKRGSRYYVKDKVGHIVRLAYPPNGKEFAREVMRELWKKGAVVSPIELTNEMMREKVIISPFSSLVEYPVTADFGAKNFDFHMQIEVRNWAGWSKGIPTERLNASNPISLRIHEIDDRRHVPWVLIGWPHPKRAKENGISYKRLERILFDMMKFSYSPKLRKLIRDYSKAFKGKNKIQIIANDGTDLTFSIKNRPINIDSADYEKKMIEIGDVGKNIPTGEIFFCPIENSANGTLVIPRAAITGEGMAEKLVITFRKGKVVKSTAKKGKDYLKNFIKKNSKDIDKIAEFGIGLNEKAEFTGGEIIIDEKIFGSIHIAIGWNKGFAGGKTNASDHIDFIKDLRNCNGKVYADNKLVINKGKLVK